MSNGLGDPAAPGVPGLPGASLKKRLLSGGAWALGGRVILMFIGLATNALLARLLSPVELGTYFLVYSVIGVCAGLGALGITQAVVRFVAESVGLKQYDRMRQALKLALGFGLLGALGVSLAYLLFGGALAASLFNSPALAAVSGVTAGWIFISVLQGIVVETFRGLHDIRMTTLLGGMVNGNGVMAGGLFSLMLLWLFLSGSKASLGTIMLLAAGSGAVTVLLASLLLRSRVASMPSGGSGARFGGGEMMRVAWPLMVTGLGIFAVMQSSLWVAGAFLGQEQVALYGAAYRLMAYVYVPMQITNMVVPPMIAEMYAQGRMRDLESTLRALTTIASIPALFILTAFILFGGPIMSLVFGSYYSEASVLLALLSFGQIVNTWAGSSGQVLMMTGHQTTVMAMTIIIGLIVVAGTTWAVQHYGNLGVASVVAGSVSLQSLVSLLIVKKKLGIWTQASLFELLSVARAGR